MRLTMVPAIIVLGLWFVLQLFSGVMSMGGLDVGGVAFWAHIGGFVAGVVLAKLLSSGRRTQGTVTWLKVLTAKPDRARPDLPAPKISPGPG